MHFIEQWGVGAAGILGVAFAICFVLWLLYSEECENFRDMVLFLVIVAGLIGGLIYLPYAIGQVLTGPSSEPQVSGSTSPTNQKEGG